MAREPKLVVLVEARLNQLEKQLKQAEQKFSRSANQMSKSSRQMSKKMESANNRLAHSFQNTAASIAVMHGPLGGIASRFSAMATLASGAGLALGGFAVAIGAGGVAAGKALAAFQKFETQQLVIEQVLRATGQASGQTGEQIEALAQGIASATLASTTEVREAAAQLLTFRSISGDTFDRTLKLAQDLATVGFGSLKSATQQLAKALEDPARGLTRLRRVGVSFTETQKEMIQSLYETGRAAEAQEEILNILEKQVGGAGGASASGLAGAVDALSQSTQNLLERWGAQIAEAWNLRAAILGISQAVDEMNRKGGTTSGQLDVINQDLAAARESLARNQGGVGPSASQAEHEEKIIEALLRRRQQLQLKLHREAEQMSMERYDAIKQGEEEAEQAQQDRAEGVIKALEKELELAGKTATQREIANRLAKAGVSAESELGQQIIKNVQAIAEAEEKLKEARKREKDAGKTNEFDREIASLEESIRLIQAETEAQAKLNPVLNDYGFAVEKANAKQALLNAAQRAGIEITPELAAKIESLSSAYAGTAAGAEKLAESQDKVREKAQELADFNKELTRGIIDGFLEGASAADIFADALKKVGDRLLNDVLDGIFQVQNAANGGGGIWGFLGSLLGLGGGFGGGGDPWAGLRSTTPGYATGTQNHPGGMAIVGERGPELVNLPKGSEVIPNHRLGGGESVVVNYAPVIDNRGASVEAVARLEQALSKDRAELKAKVVSIVRRRPKENW
ncbi:phage tail length tape measure family protein [Nitratireductor sp. GCM10026969]|uniref:phage tail length tape measure family protein n=1 Tax=Nitratireductor sp. GCM10026969 TaxID=3252645 RepID=UPI00360B8FFA